MKYLFILLLTITLACSGFAQNIQVGFRTGVYQSYHIRSNHEVDFPWGDSPTLIENRKYDPYILMLSPHCDKALFARIGFGKTSIDVSYAQSYRTYQDDEVVYYFEPGTFGNASSEHNTDYNSYSINIAHLDLSIEHRLFSINKIKISGGITGNLNFMAKNGNTITYTEETNSKTKYENNITYQFMRIGISETAEYKITKRISANLAFRQVLSPNLFHTNHPFVVYKYPFLGCSYTAGLGYNF
jgi:hypothetical protein